MRIRYLIDIERENKLPIPAGTIVNKTNEAARELIKQKKAVEVKEGEINEDQPRSKDNPIEEVEEVLEEEETKKKKK